MVAEQAWDLIKDGSEVGPLHHKGKGLFRDVEIQ